MNTRNILCVLTASALVSGMLGSCSLTEARDRTAIDDVLTGYIGYIEQADYESSKLYVVDEEEFFADNAFADNDAALIAAIWEQTEFNVADIVIDETSATAQVEFIFPDLESISEEGYSLEEFVEAIPGITDTNEQILEFELTKDADEWRIESESTEDLYNLLLSLIENLEFGRLTEENAVAAVEEFMTSIADGNLQDASTMLSATDNTYFTYAQAASSASGALGDGINNVFAGYFGRADYETSATEVTDEYIMVTVSGTAPDLQATVDSVLNNQNIMVPIYADYIEGYINNNLNMFAIAGSLFEALSQEIEVSPIVPLEIIFKVTEGDDGNLYLEPVSGPDLDIDINSLSSRTDLIVPAVAQLFQEGRITFDQMMNIEELMGT